MRPVSDRFLEALRGSHKAAFAAYVVAAGQTGTAPTGTEIPIISGDVEIDATASVRSTLAITTDGTGTFPDSASDLFAPYGNEIFVRRGVEFGGGAVEWVSLGYFRINSVEQDDAPNGPLRIAAQDRMAGLIEARLLAPIQFASTATYGSVVTQLVQEVYPWATIEWDDLTWSDALARSVIAEEDRYDFLNELVTSRGKIWYWDHRGVLVIKDTPTQDDPVWEVNAGENGVLVHPGGMARDLSREGVYNGVKAAGEALDNETPVYAVAVDDNPDSPTYWSGGFGKVPRFYSSPFITTTAQALTTAQSLLRKKLGLPYAVDFRAIPNPALEPWDPVGVNITGARQAPTETLLLDTFSRTATDTWGTNDTGQTYNFPGSAANFDITPSGTGTISVPTANNVELVTANGVSSADVDMLMTVAVPNVATGASLVIGAVSRYTSGNYYKARIEFNVGGSLTVKFSKYVDSVFTELASYANVVNAAYTASQGWKVRFRNYGNVLRMRIWLDGAAEPTAWTLETIDDSLVSGSVGVWVWRLASNTNTSPQYRVHHLEVNSYERQRAGTEIHVIERVTIPLTNDPAMTADTREQTLVVFGEAS